MREPGAWSLDTGRAEGEFAVGGLHIAESEFVHCCHLLGQFAMFLPACDFIDGCSNHSGRQKRFLRCPLIMFSICYYLSTYTMCMIFTDHMLYLDILIELDTQHSFLIAR
jgi:hypothetical protein